MGATRNNLRRQGCFIGEDDLGAADAPDDFLGVVFRRPIVDRQLAQGLQRRPAQVAGVSV